MGVSILQTEPRPLRGFLFASPLGSAMDALSKSGEGPRFVGIIEHLSDGWRASFRLRVSGEVFTQQGDTEIFATELQATKWLHTQATERGCSAIEIRHADSRA